ncbi:ABC transporter permease YtrF [Blautia producta]|uniref:ABC transporter permease YtrF n=1 Tax=Blautia producta TaxID=33035 RepID=A0A4P6M642_9FIRM|nr:ABC transporter permease [Blautia producta]QBE99675.1 ABC transporter permease YtrF [Blautia producta]
MNIFHKVALQGLIKNRTRTLVTIIGVALSAALITAVSVFAVSLQNYMINGAVKKYGDWHVQFTDVDDSFVQEQAEDSRVSEVVSTENIGFAMLNGGQNPDKPYLFIAGFNRETFDALPITLLLGRMPENSSEILIPAHVASNGGVKISVGDTLTLAVGSRRAGDETLSQHDPYRQGEESLAFSEERTYTVVGVCQRPSFEEYAAPGYTLITMADNAEGAEHLSAFVTLEKPGQIRSYVKSAAQGHAYVLNDDVLRFMGVSGDKLFNTLLYSLGIILVALVMLGSVFLIYNSFHISLNERTHQFGIFMSVGATEKQLRNSVVFEGICIGLIGIPAGMLIGIPGIRLVLSLVAKNFANVLYSDVPLTLKVSVPALAASVVISMITILISAYIPAKKAARTPVMECIRQTNEIKVEAKDIKTAGFTKHFFGLEGTLASKNFKRNKRRYRSIILSLSLSVVLFVSSSSFVMNLKQTSKQADVVTDYDIGFDAQNMDDSEMLGLYDKMKTAEGVTHSSYQALMEFTCAVRTEQLSDAYLKSKGDTLRDDTEDLPMEIQFLDDTSYLQIIKSLGLTANAYTLDDTRTKESMKLIAVAKMEDTTGKAEEVSQLENVFRDSTVDADLIPEKKGEPVTEWGKNVSITCVDLVPPDAPTFSGKYEQKPYFFQIIAPWSLKETLAPQNLSVDVRGKGITFRSDSPGKSTEQMQAIIEGTGITSDYALHNVYAMLEQNRNILFIVNLFAVVFIAMISLIAVANVFNTISTNIKLRRREFAMLRSVGMSDREFNKMMRYECLLYGLRTLLFGLPISGILSWLIYKGMFIGGSEIDFIFPWGSLAVSILGVFLVIFITMIYAAEKIRKENIIEALRDDMA